MKPNKTQLWLTPHEVLLLRAALTHLDESSKATVMDRSHLVCCRYARENIAALLARIPAKPLTAPAPEGEAC